MYKATIGLEIHFESKTNSKMFCSCPNEENNSLEEKPNINACPVCAGHPGTLPVINKEAINKIIKTGLALNCKIAEHTKFDRKNYFYPDLPKGYQISQFDMPICFGGYLDVPLDDGSIKRVRITRIHMEEDTAKSYHTKDGTTLIDFNRSSVPLMELVTEPDIHTGEEAKRFAQEIQLILKYLDVSNADMEKGQMRCEVNISVNTEDDDELGTKVEIKNLNSFKTVEKSIEYETKRQIEALENKEKIIQETRGWDDNKELTFSQRSKEDAHEYRYFPEPDLPPLSISSEKIEAILSSLPELPNQKRDRYKNEYNLDHKTIEFFVRKVEVGIFFEKAVSELISWYKESNQIKEIADEKYFEIIKLCTNYITTDLQSILKSDPELKGIEDVFVFLNKKISPENFGEFICLIANKKITSKIAKTVLLEMYSKGKDPTQIIEDEGLSPITDDSELEKIIITVLEKNPKPVEDYKAGKQNSFAFLIGQIMSVSKGKANPQKAAELLKKVLEK
ncbi:MAG: Asp-tRNA(Asn)/Glu-tRNA(Gln) amidotransferase subunit GatB [Candidatus Paceibacterota bacterium]|jgi:aspartyl-tRNA(Asn)/glutamyl-tRNA(Gln) amidotransferase subunit B|nr:Asp-tRNA(Asn)/Glu-tRNA(Gln) amidotransferase subunit GatB [bacterium]